jgi:hypothetical protein
LREVEKNMKQFLKGAVVFLIATVLFLSTIVTANTVENRDDDQLNPAYIKGTGSDLSGRNDIQSFLGPVMFSQLPFTPNDPWRFTTSDIYAGYRVYDNYWDVTEDIYDIHWWGLSLFWTGSGWMACDPIDMQFEIIFWDSILGLPICVYIVGPPALSTGLLFGNWELYYWEVNLVPCCPQRDGWVSIQSIDSPYDCWFIWAGSDDGDLYSYQENGDPPDLDYDQAFELTADGPHPIPTVCCDPEMMQWTNVKPGSVVTGNFYVWNCGDDGSILTWSVDSYPLWMPDVAFTHPGGILVGGGSGQVVDFTFTAPSQPTESYSGVIKVINIEDPTDNCEMATSLQTPRNKDMFFYFFEYLINQFPLLQQLLQRFGLQ